MATTDETTNSAPASTAVTAPRAEEIAAGANRLAQELQEFLQDNPSLQTASTATVQAKSEIPEMQLATCRKLREVSASIEPNRTAQP